MNGAAVMWMMALACSAPSDADDDTGAETDEPVVDTDTEVLDTDTDTDPDTDTDEPDTGRDDDEAYAAFYDPNVVQRIDLELGEDALAALRADPETYVSGVFVHDGYRLENVGVRLKGGSSTFEPIDEKPSFKLKLDEFEESLDYGGFDRVNLHNMRADPAQAREVVAYAVWAAAGYAAPRANFAEVYVNGASYGVYANVEEVDGAFAERHFAEPDGDLWDAGDPADLTGDYYDNYESVGGDGDLDALDAARRQIQTGDGAFYDVANEVLVMDQFLDFWAWQIATANEDGYPYDLDDHALYADPAEGGRYVYVPWGLDETWDTTMEWDAYAGTVAVKCAYDTACLLALETRVAAALATYEGLGIDVIARAALDVSLSAVQSDSRRDLPLGDVTVARSQLLTAINGRPAAVRLQMGL